MVADLLQRKNEFIGLNIIDIKNNLVSLMDILLTKQFPHILLNQKEIHGN